MTLNWQTTTDSKIFKTDTSDANYTLHAAQVADAPNNNGPMIKQAIGEAIEKASSLLDANIDDESLFLMFEWDETQPCLTIAVTDDTKAKTSPDVVRCSFATLDEQYDTQQIQLLVKDYLSTCKQFLRFSLVAMFNTGSRENCELL